MNDSRKTGLLRLKHLREVNEAHAEEHNEHRQRFDLLRDPTSKPRAVSAFNLFQTPEEIAARMVAKAIFPATQGVGRILEPSAGLGRLYRAIRTACTGRITLVEIAPQLCAELYRETEGDDHASLIQADFLACDEQRLGGLFDCVVMNPPFKQGCDVKHITHALRLLRPGGRLVSLCYAGARQHEKLKPLADTWEILPAASFRSEGTRADVVIMTVNG